MSTKSIENFDRRLTQKCLLSHTPVVLNHIKITQTTFKMQISVLTNITPSLHKISSQMPECMATLNIFDAARKATVMAIA